MEIRAASVTAFYLYDVAEQIDLATLRSTLRAGAAAKLQTATSAPSYLQYQTPPLVVDGNQVGVASIDGFSARLKFFDYGVVSLALTRPFEGSWAELIAASQTYIENEALESRAEAAVRGLVRRCPEAMVKAREQYVAEDYLAVAVMSLETPLSSDELLAQRGEVLARIVRGERQPLSPQEQDEVLRNRLSYLANDLVIPTWNCAFIYDSEPGAIAALELFEFANSQLLEFRYYDDLLDSELGRIYAMLQVSSWWNNLFGRGYVRAAHQLHALFIDVNELTDRTENALKIVGDIYAARVFNLAAARLGLARWKQSVGDKLKTLDDIYRFAVEQVAISRGQFLELTVILILVLELVLFFLGIMK
ncbi:MAG TPA: hypothetical protein VEL51_06665 [Vicinamibacterales bacterium]|nr:hypothetical protein [Vicinamibacterales bacterium]